MESCKCKGTAHKTTKNSPILPSLKFYGFDKRYQGPVLEGIVSLEARGAVVLERRWEARPFYYLST